MRRRTATLAIVALATLAARSSAAPLATDAPDSAVNPKSGKIEIADPVWSGSSQDINYVIQGPGAAPKVQVVTADPLDDERPRLAIAASGDAWVVWWRDDVTDRVMARKRSYATGAWSAERTVSLVGESSRNPHVVHDGVQAWVAYEIDQGSGCGVGVGVITDEPDPIDCSVVAATTFSGSLDLLIHAAPGRLWVTWVDGPTTVGWSQRDAASGLWSAAAYESAIDGVPEARARIEATVLAP